MITPSPGSLVLSGALLLLAANAFVGVHAQETTPAVPGAAPESPAPVDTKPADAPTQSEERDAVQPAVSESIISEPASAEPVPAPPAPASGTRFRTMDRIELDSTAITGNRELPKVLYIVPWKKADLGDLVGRPANSLLDEVLTPVDREVFRRQTEYFSKLDTVSAGGANQPEPEAVPAPPR